jgi:hypothetical protein
LASARRLSAAEPEASTTKIVVLAVRCLKPRQAEVVGADLEPTGPAAQLLPRRRGTQRRENIERRAAIGTSGARADLPDRARRRAWADRRGRRSMPSARPASRDREG